MVRSCWCRSRQDPPGRPLSSGGAWYRNEQMCDQISGCSSGRVIVSGSDGQNGDGGCMNRADRQLGCKEGRGTRPRDEDLCMRHGMHFFKRRETSRWAILLHFACMRVKKIYLPPCPPLPPAGKPVAPVPSALDRVTFSNGRSEGMTNIPPEACVGGLSALAGHLLASSSLFESKGRVCSLSLCAFLPKQRGIETQ